MLGFAIALAIPFTLFALFPSLLKSAPRSGGWMNVVKVTLGFIELAFALKFLSVADLAYSWHILDREVFLSLWIVIFGLLGVYLLGWLKFPHDDEGNRTNVPQFFLAMISLAFAIYMIPGLWGAPLKAISAFAPPMNTQDFVLQKITTEARFKDYEQGMAAARAEGKPVLIDFTGFGCVNCRKMEAAVWSDAQVADILNNKYVLISLYVDDKTPLAEPIEVEDCARHFFPLQVVKDYIDMIALHGMNKFHWHITEDQGWRIEIKKWPKLTTVGAWRSGTVIGRNSSIEDGIPHGGFYTQDECREIVKYAADRYITVIPETDMPGHMLGALAAYPL